MKRAEIEKILKAEADNYTPDPLDNIKAAARAENLLPSDSERDAEIYVQGGAAVKAKKRKTAGFLAAVAAFGICVALILSFILKGGNPPFVPAGSLSANDVYGMGAVTTVKLLGNNLPAGAVQSLSAVRASAASYDNGDVKAQAEKFNEYFSALDSFFGEDIVSTATYVNTDANYSYDTKMIINGMDFNGKSATYTMYYTETLVKTRTDHDEVKSEYKLEGVMVIDGTDYYLEGEREEETDRHETETELKIRAYADLADKTSYVQMKQECSVESDETETQYVYSVYAKGKLIEQTAIEFETEEKNGKIETEYELEFRSGSAKGRYKVERDEKNGITDIKVSYDIDGTKGEFRINEIVAADGNKQYEYVFSDNSILRF